MLFQQLLVGEHPAYHQTATRLVFGWIGKLNDKCTNGLTECRTEQPAATMGFASCNDNGNGTLGHSSSFWHRYWSATMSIRVRPSAFGLTRNGESRSGRQLGAEPWRAADEPNILKK
eukprot:EG_transcript_30538